MYPQVVKKIVVVVWDNIGVWQVFDSSFHTGDGWKGEQPSAEVT